MRWLPALVLVAGCLASVPADDRDADRIPDSADNCPDVANADQSDVNHDGTGDACELCDSSDPTDTDADGIPDACDGCDNTQPDDNGNGVPDVCENPHDEDGDTIPDLHDNCPSIANPDQLDTDEGSGIPDGVGNACDRGGEQDRQLFDAFTQPNQLWVVEGQGWQVTKDQASAPCSGAGAFRFAGSARNAFQVRTHAGVQPAGEVGVVLLDGGSMGNQVRVMCMLRVGTPSVIVLDIGGGVQTAPYMGPPDADITLQGDVNLTGNGATFTCIIPGASGKLTGTALSSSSVWVTGVGTLPYATQTGGDVTGTATFDYFDVVTSG